MTISILTKYELSITYVLTRAADSKILAHQLLEKEKKEQQELINRCQYMINDRAYDDVKTMGYGTVLPAM